MTPEIAMIAQAAGPWVAPYIPLILKASEGAAEQLGRDLGSEAEQLIRRVLTALRKRAETNPAARLALESAVHGGETASSVVEAQLISVLRADRDLATQLAAFLFPRSDRRRVVKISAKTLRIKKSDVVAGKVVKKRR